MAIELGANLLGEIIIFVIGAGVLLLEYQRQSRKETLKDEMVLQEKYELQATLNELAFQAERQDTQIRELTRLLADLRKKFSSMSISPLTVIHIFFLDSKSWTPQIISDIVGGKKKIQSECECENDNPLELLPEKRSKKPLKTDQSKNVLKEQNITGNESTLIKAINMLLTEVFYSQRSPSPVEVMPGESILARSLNYLFVNIADSES